MKGGNGYAKTRTVDFPLEKLALYSYFGGGDVLLYRHFSGGKFYYGKIIVGGDNWPRGYKTFFMLNSTEHEIFPAHKC